MPRSVVETAELRARWRPVRVPTPRQPSLPTLADERGEIRALTGLRVVAAMWVLLYHLQMMPGVAYPPYTEALRPVLAAGALGVDLFFILSGFVITYTYLDRFGPSQGARQRIRASISFLWARIARIWPMYLLVTVVFGLWLAWRSRSAGETFTFQALPPEIDPLGWATQLLGVQQWFSASCLGCSFFISGWSVSAEWFAYACFPLLVLVIWQLRRLPAPVLGVLAVLVMVPLALVVYRTGNMYFPWSWLARIGAGFASGALVYLAVRRVRRSPRVARIANLVAVLAVVEILVGLYLADGRPRASELEFYGTVVVVFFPVLLGALALSDGRLRGWLSAPVAVHGGQLSYSLYLIHIPVFEVFWTAAQHFDSIAPGTPNAAFLAPQVVLLTLVLAHLMFRHLEEPARHWMRRRDPTRRLRRSDEPVAQRVRQVPRLDPVQPGLRAASAGS